MNPSDPLGIVDLIVQATRLFLIFHLLALIAVLSLGLIGCASIEISSQIGTDKLMGWGMGRNKRATNRVLLIMHGRAYNFQSVLHE